MKYIHEYVVEITSEIVEKQDEILMQTIQNIGGKEFRHITVDKNKVSEALRDYVKKQDNKADFVEVVRCKDCKHFYADTYNGKVLRRECRLRSVECGIGSVTLESENDFCSYGERRDT